jgi:hypothetical protein
MDLRSDLGSRLVARQLRHSILRYMSGEQFRPRETVEVDAIRALLR